MVKLIMGENGVGKTKQIIDLVNAAVKEEKGSVVCIASGNNLNYDISHDARLIDTSSYMVSGYECLFGFVSGIHAGNYDISQVFIDGLCKIVNDTDTEHVEKFLVALDEFSSKHSVSFTISVSADESTATPGMKKFI